MKALTYTLREAADILGKNLSVVTNWARDGLFRSYGSGKHVRLNRADVLKVKEDLINGRQLEAQNPREYVAEIQLKIARIERILEALCRNQGIDTSGDLGDINDADLYRLYVEATSGLAKTRWEYMETRQWASTLLRMSEADLERLSAITDNSRPWVIFLDLVMNIRSWWRQQAATPEAMEISYLLSRVAERLRRAVKIYSEKANREPDYLFAKYLEDPPINRLIRFAFSDDRRKTWGGQR